MIICCFQTTAFSFLSLTIQRTHHKTKIELNSYWIKLYGENTIKKTNYYQIHSFKFSYFIAHLFDSS